MSEDQAPFGGEAEESTRSESTRFKPGQSGNPGGRPRRDEVVRRLASKRGGDAVALLVELLGGAGAVIVIDARAVLLDWSDRLVERGLNAIGPTPEQAQRAALFQVGQEAANAWAEAWDEEATEISGDGRSVQISRTYVNRETGERLGAWDWLGMQEAVREAAIDAAAAAAAGAEISREG